MNNKQDSAHQIDARNSTFISVLQWRGARPDILDLNEDQTGNLLCLLFVREGDCCALPLAWRYEQAQADPVDPLQPTIPFTEQALDLETMRMAQRSLEQDGWRVSGRLDLHFEGAWTGPRFWQQIEIFLQKE